MSETLYIYHNNKIRIDYIGLNSINRFTDIDIC